MAENLAIDSPRGPWGRIWILAIALIVLQIGGLEVFWRLQGHRPSIEPSVQLWCYHRDRLLGAGRDTLAVLGASRIQLGLVQEEFLRLHPNLQLVQLAVPAKGPYAALRDLAEDDSFRGSVLCAVEEVAMQPIHLEDQQEYVAYHREKWGPGKKVSLLLSVIPQLALAQLQPRLGGIDLLRWLRMGRLPLVGYTETTFDRQRTADYSKVDTKMLIATRFAFLRDELLEHPPATDGEWRDIVDGVAGFVRQIEARGGNVVFVKFPIAGRLLAQENADFPRERYWDVLAAGVGTDVIHYEEMPGYESLNLPDDSHLDSAGSVAFTVWLAGEIDRRDLFD